MPFVAKKTPGSIGDHVWDKPGAVVEVDDDLAHHLTSLVPDEYEIADPPKAAASNTGNPTGRSKAKLDRADT